MIEDINSALATLHPQVPLFGAILFTERDANVIKALKDPEYYNALHVASGDSLAIFATMMFPGHYGFPPSRPGVIMMMTQVWQEPRANLQLLSAFGLRDSEDFPTFALFAFEGDQMHYHLHKIASDTPAKVFESLGAVITATCDGSASPSFAAARKKLKWLTVKSRIRRVFDFVGAFRGVSGI
jgi:hypothetical protein